MNKAIYSLYPQDSVNFKRTATDSLFSDPNISIPDAGNFGSAINYITENQLLRPDLWARFVDQFRLRADGTNNGWRGEYWGKMMRGAAFVYSLTKNPELYKVMEDTVKDMLTAEDELGRISSYTVETEFRGWDLWSRKYVLLGMQYFAEVCPDKELIEQMKASMMRQADYLISKLGREDGKLRITYASNCWRGLNSSSILEPIVRLYDLTGEQKYLDFASYIVSEGGTQITDIFELAYKDTTDPYQYPVTKAYEMMSCFEGLLEYYRATGIEKYKQAVIRFARRVRLSDITIIGSAGCTHELFDHSAARQTEYYPGIMQETCVTVTWMKFCWQLLSLTGDPAYADSFEEALYNAYLGSVNTQNITCVETIRKYSPEAIPEALPFDSYSPLLMGTRGRGIGGFQVMPDKHHYGCCACIGAAGIGLISKVAGMISEKGVAINLYGDAALDLRTPANRPAKFTVSGGYPVKDTVTIKLGLEAPESFEVALRIPEWSNRAVITVNGEKLDTKPGYTGVTREWKDGDEIVIVFDMRARVIHAPGCGHDILMTAKVWNLDISYPTVFDETPEAKFHIALKRGPVVLARDARLGEDVDKAVDIKYDIDGVVEVEPTENTGFECMMAYKVPEVHGGYFTVVDYSSAGKTWDESSKMGCWFPTR